MTSTRKKVIPTKIEAHPDESALLIWYMEEERLLDEKGDTVDVVSRKERRKRIGVRDLDEMTDIGNLAEQLVNNCKLIDSSRTAEVLHVLSELHSRVVPPERPPEVTPFAVDLENLRSDELVMEEEEASMDDLESYVEALYSDEIDEKIEGAHSIMLLSRSPEHLPILVSDERLMNVLSRELKEEGKRSYLLGTNILYVFYCLSNYVEFHSLIKGKGIGGSIMQLIDLECKRTQHRLSALESKRIELNSSTGSQKRKITEELISEERQLRAMFERQDPLLILCFNILLHLADDMRVERKMTRRNLVFLLSQMLDRQNTELLVLSLTFLKKLSIVSENKGKMRECGVVERVWNIMGGNLVTSEPLMRILLRLLFNLSFDGTLREQMVQVGIIPKFVSFLTSGRYVDIVVTLLYQFSQDDRVKSMFSYTDVVSWVLALMKKTPEQDDRTGMPVHVNRELSALAVNLSLNARNAEMLSSNGELEYLISRALRTKDPLVMRIVRNISRHDTPKPLFKKHVEELVAMAKGCGDPRMVMQIISIIGNLTTPEFEFSKLVKRFSLVPFLEEILESRESEELMFEVAVLVGTIVSDSNTALMVAESSVLDKLCDLIFDSQDDDELCVQIAYTLYKCALYDSTRQRILERSEILPMLVDMLQDTSQDVRSSSSQTLDILSSADDTWAAMIRKYKFEAYNAAWLDAITDDGVDDRMDESDTLGVSMESRPLSSNNGSEEDLENIQLWDVGTGEFTKVQ